MQASDEAMVTDVERAVDRARFSVTVSPLGSSTTPQRVDSRQPRKFFDGVRRRSSILGAELLGVPSAVRLEKGGEGRMSDRIRQQRTMFRRK